MNIKRSLSFILALFLSISLIPINAVHTGAAAKTLTTAQLRQKFPHGKYWNGGNSDSFTSTPCYHHGNCSYSGSCGCNSFQGFSIQCMGYAEKLAFDATGYNPRKNANGWYTYTSASALNNLKPGDIVRYNGHSIYVIGVQGDIVTYTDCNSDGRCVIRWDATISKATLRASFVHLRSAPSSATNTPAQCNCSATYAGKYICNTSPDSALNIRSGHGINYGIIGSIPPGAVVNVLKASGSNNSDWAHIEYNGISGFVSVEFLKKQETVCAHSYAGGVCTKCKYEFPLKISEYSSTMVVTSWGANLWSKPYSSGTSKVIRTASKGSTLSIVAKTANAAGSTWYKLSDGSWVYSGNVSEKPPVSFNASDVVPHNGTFYVTSWGANLWSKPYSSGDSKVLRTVSKGTGLTIVGKVTNSSLSLWYKLSDGSWIYSANVAEKPPLSYNPSDIVAISKGFTVTSWGANLWSKPYSSEDSKVVRTATKGTNLIANAKVINSSGSLWYRLTDDSWVYSGNVTERPVTYSVSDIVPLSNNYIITNWGTNIWSMPYSSRDSQYVKTIGKGVTLKVIAKVMNSSGSIWYQLSDKEWIFSGNVAVK